MAEVIRLKFFSNQVKGLASILITVKNKNILIDPGIPFHLFKTKKKPKLIKDFLLPQLNYIVISHYHGDHASLTSEILAENSFKGELITHQATSDIIQAYYAINPGYDSRFKKLGYGEKYALTDDISLTLFNAGHVLGSAMIYLTIGQKHILISGDIGARSLPIVSDPNKVFPGKSLNLMVLDGKNAELNHEIDLTKDSLGNILYQKLADCFLYDNGNVLMYLPKIQVPIFIYCLNYLFTNPNFSHFRHKIKDVYLEKDTRGVRVKQLLEIFNRYAHLFDKREKEYSLLSPNQFHFNQLRQEDPDFSHLTRSILLTFNRTTFIEWFKHLKSSDKNDILLLYQNIAEILDDKLYLIDKECKIQIKRLPRIHFHPDKQELSEWCEQLQHQIKIEQILFYHSASSGNKEKMKSFFRDKTGIPISLDDELPDQSISIPYS